MTVIGNPKPRPAALERKDRRRKLKAFDESESRKVRIRSTGRCEAVVIGEGRCPRHACHVHHMMGGNGVRGRGESAKMERKQHLCGGCHQDIGAHILKRTSGLMPRWTDRYTRAR